MTKSIHQLYKLQDNGEPLVCLAPMAGFTNAAMRCIAGEHGAALTFTEMTSDMGLLHEREKTWQLLERFDDEPPVVGHLYGSNPQTLAEAARKVEENGKFAGIDLNTGCPVKKITQNGAGSALIKSPQLIYKILSAMRKEISIPLSIKTRLGEHPGKTAIFDILKAAEDAGADLIILHARFTSQGHGGDPDLDLLAELKSRASIPVIGNGGIRSPWDAWRMFKETGVDAIMVARSAIGNPWIFEDIRAGLAASEPPEEYNPTRGRPKRDLNKVRQALIKHLNYEQSLIEHNRSIYECPDRVQSVASTLATTFRCHLFRYLHGLKGSSYLRSHLYLLNSMDSIIAAVDNCLEREEAYRRRVVNDE
ncbi:MAG: tRNA-dihydrouridine synthase family protein [Kiritimatiellae bacterium]|nr:tRNA-dihydrouridine synthase family protein [Kiritimatiellia bacterium]